MRLTFPNVKNQLRAGMNATVRVKNNNGKQKSIVIPHKAVLEQLGEYYVYTLGDSSKVSQRRIHLGQQIGSNIIVTDGLSEGDVFVVQGIQNLREGSVVNTSSPAKK
jgi:membrane fusion protein (multidrug efflux system)